MNTWEETVADWFSRHMGKVPSREQLYWLLQLLNKADIAIVTAERDAALKDAERYRWLREHTAVTGLSRFVHRMGKQFLDETVDSQLRVDAAMNETNDE